MGRRKPEYSFSEDWKTASCPHTAGTYMGVGIIWLIVMGLIWFSERDNVRGLFIPMSNWKSTHGVITSSALKYQEGNKGVGQFVTDIHYSYWIGDQHYQGNRIGFGAPFSRKKEIAEKFVAKYPARSSVTVHYLEQVPSISALEPEYKSYGGLIFLILLTLPGPALIVAGIVYRQREYARFRFLITGGE